MKKPPQPEEVPDIPSDEEAEEFVATADLTEYDLSGSPSASSSSRRQRG